MEKIKIITLGDIFKYLETDDQAFEFLHYIKNLQQENERQINIINNAIEYIENSIKYYNGERLENTKYNYVHIDTIDTLLYILKESKEENK